MEDTDALSETVANFLRNWRKERGLSQYAMSDLLGWTRETLATKERGTRRRFVLEDLETICRATETALPDVLRATERGRKALRTLLGRH